LRRAVKVAQSVSFEARIVVSTDSPDYLIHVEPLIGKQEFLRPDYLSGDQIGDVEVLVHSLHASEILYKEEYSCVVMIQPTSPLRHVEHVNTCYDYVQSGDFSSAITCHQVDSKYHPYKSLTVDADGLLSLFYEDGGSIVSRQQLSSAYIRNGAAYCVSTAMLCIKKSLFAGKTKAVITEPMISIDTHEDLVECERIIASL